MAGDIKDAGTLAGVGRYGVPWHGRIEAGTLYTDGAVEVTRTWPQPASADCWLIQRPGLPDPYLDAAAAKAADAAEGKELTNWALLSGAGDIHGKPFARTNDDKHRWIWVDDDGDVFSVVFGLVAGDAVIGTRIDYDGFPVRDFSFSAGMTARFKFRRFGRLVVGGTPAADTVVVDHVIAAGALGQSTPEIAGASAGNMILRDLTPTGNRALFEVHSLATDTFVNRYTFELDGEEVSTRRVSHREFSNGLGWVEFALSGTGAAPTVEFNLIANRAQTLGAYTLDVPSNSVSEDSATIHIIYECIGRILGYRYDGAGVAQIDASMDFRHEQSYRWDKFEDCGPVELDEPCWYYSTSSNTRTMQVKVVAGANSLTVNRVVNDEHTVELPTYVCYPNDPQVGGYWCEVVDPGYSTRTITVTGDSGAPGESYTASAAVDWLEYAPIVDGFEFFHAAAGSSWSFPTGTQSIGMSLGVFRLGPHTYALFYGARDSEIYSWGLTDNFTRSLAVLSRDVLQVTYNAWDSWIYGSRRYGAWNPVTQELFFPLYNPVNFT